MPLPGNRRSACRAFACASIAAVLLAVPAGAQVADSTPSGMLLLDETKLIGLGAAHLATSPLRWNRVELRAAASAAVGIFALSSLDEAGREFMLRQQSAALDDATNEIERLGTVENFYVLGTFFVAGVALDDAKARGVAAEGLASSLIAAGVVTPTLQKLVGRLRPRKDRASHTFAPMSGNLSFPSGHTTQAFAVASVIATEYDHRAVQVAAYGLASAVAASRMYHRAHFLSDVTTAALIGTVVGRSVAHYGQRRRGELTVQPTLHLNGGDGFGFGVTISH